MLALLVVMATITDPPSIKYTAPDPPDGGALGPRPPPERDRDTLGAAGMTGADGGTWAAGGPVRSAIGASGGGSALGVAAKSARRARPWPSTSRFSGL